MARSLWGSPTFFLVFCKLKKNICINILKMSTILSLRVASFLFILCFCFSFPPFSSLSRLDSAVLESITEACYFLSSGYCVLPPTSPCPHPHPPPPPPQPPPPLFLVKFLKKLSPTKFLDYASHERLICDP